jgi:hypothetical protein
MPLVDLKVNEIMIPVTIKEVIKELVIDGANSIATGETPEATMNIDGWIGKMAI